MSKRQCSVRFICKHSILLFVFYTTSIFSSVSAVTLEKQNEVLFWNSQALDLIKSNNIPPPKASRILGLLHLSIFEAANASARQYQPYEMDVHELKDTPLVPLVVHVAGYVLQNQFPDQAASIQQIMDERLVNAGEDMWGGMIANLILKHHPLAFGHMEDPTVVKGYAWIATPPAFNAYLLPEWCALQPLGILSPKQFRKAGPPAIDSDEFAAALEETKSLGAKNSETRTADQTQIALFWADGKGTVTPPGHWNQIASSMIQEKVLSLVETAHVMALLNMAMADAAIVAWDMKYAYQFARPVTVFQNDGWEPLIATPPFPEYVSGHSTFSSAAATVLTHELGATPFTTTSDGLPGVSRSFQNFEQAAAEAGRSRIYGGIHFAFSDSDGQTAGKELASYILSHRLQKTKGELAKNE